MQNNYDNYHGPTWSQTLRLEIKEISEKMKKYMCHYYCHITWRCYYVMEMLFARENNIPIEGLSRHDINHMVLYFYTILTLFV